MTAAYLSTMKVPKHIFTTAANRNEVFIIPANCLGFFMLPSMLGKTACAQYENTMIPNPMGNVCGLNGGMFAKLHKGI